MQQPGKQAGPSSQAFKGVEALNPILYNRQRVQPLPYPNGVAPYHFDIKSIIPGIEAMAAKQRKIVFHTAGDVGGIVDPAYQLAVAAQMKKDLQGLPENERPAFFYLLGDVAYNFGQHAAYYQQFYKPYHGYNAPIIGIAGNHDADTFGDGQPSLDGWVKYFMSKTPHIDPVSRDVPRTTVCLPNVYYTLLAPYVTIIGLYTNLPEHGSVDSQQLQWLTSELATAPADKALIIAMHNPVYSFDMQHGGSPLMGHVLHQAINESRRVPNAVLTGHVHNYQRIEKRLAGNMGTIPFFVCGIGGYFGLHSVTAENGYTDVDTNATLVYGNADYHGYLTLAIDEESINGYVTLVDIGGSVKRDDYFSYSAKAVRLGEGERVEL